MSSSSTQYTTIRHYLPGSSAGRGHWGGNEVEGGRADDTTEG